MYNILFRFDKTVRISRIKHFIIVIIPQIESLRSYFLLRVCSIQTISKIIAVRIFSCYSLFSFCLFQKARQYQAEIRAKRTPADKEALNEVKFMYNILFRFDKTVRISQIKHFIIVIIPQIALRSYFLLRDCSIQTILKIIAVRIFSCYSLFSFCLFQKARQRYAVKRVTMTRTEARYGVNFMFFGHHL
jgi:hypothetical protein